MHTPTPTQQMLSLKLDYKDAILSACTWYLQYVKPKPMALILRPIFIYFCVAFFFSTFWKYIYPQENVRMAHGKVKGLERLYCWPSSSVLIKNVLDADFLLWGCGCIRGETAVLYLSRMYWMYTSFCEDVGKTAVLYLSRMYWMCTSFCESVGRTAVLYLSRMYWMYTSFCESVGVSEVRQQFCICQACTGCILPSVVWMYRRWDRSSVFVRHVLDAYFLLWCGCIGGETEVLYLSGMYWMHTSFCGVDVSEVRQKFCICQACTGCIFPSVVWMYRRWDRSSVLNKNVLDANFLVWECGCIRGETAVLYLSRMYWMCTSFCESVGKTTVLYLSRMYWMYTSFCESVAALEVRQQFCICQACTGCILPSVRVWLHWR